MSFVPLAGCPLNFLKGETGTIAQFDPDGGPKTRYIFVDPPMPNTEAVTLLESEIDEMPDDLQAILRGEKDTPAVSRIEDNGECVADDGVVFATWRRR